uniref:Pericentrin/AKAP-450 centrosomal targeting domain-containing protein n=1 Tax=Cacopsylla melanoneura TaxID=428564 RepID=A0A8D8VMS7_9HEMI
MNGNVQTSTENEQNSPSALYLDAVKGVLLLWHEEIMGGGGDIQNLNSVLVQSAQGIASCLQSEQSRQELQYVHQLVMTAIEQDRLVPLGKPLNQKHEEELFLLSKHFDKRYQHIINSSDLTDSSLPMHQRNGSLLEYNKSWNGSNNTHTQNDLKYTQEEFEEKLSEYTQKLTMNLEKKYIKELEDMNKKHEATIRQVEKFYENKLADTKVNSSFSKIESENEMSEIIADRDNLREMTKNLRQVVTDLTNYVNNCETQLNKTLLNELLEDTSGIDDCSSFQQLKHVHFAPDISNLVAEDRLDYSDLRLELESCLDRLKREASELLSATQAKCKHQGLEEIVARYEREIEQLKLDAITPEMQSLQHQIEAADAQLRSSRQFLEEQAAERDAEREELLGQITKLKTALREQKLANSFDDETKLLEQQLEEAQKQIKIISEEKQSSEENLSEAKAKIWELREIVSNLEKELATSRENEAALASKINEWEELFDKQMQAHQDLVVEFETVKQNVKSQGMNEAMELPLQDISGLHQIKTQILWLERSLSRRTKELETLYVFDANLSSPSEDISARDEMVNTPDSGRVDSPGLPLEQMSCLYEQFVRHSRAEDATVKCLRDTVLQLTAVRSQLSEVQLERDALQGRYNKTLAELSEAKVQREELRHTLFQNKTDRDQEKHAEMDMLQDKVKTLAKALLIKEEEMKEKERMMEQKDRMMWSLEQELSSKQDITDHRIRDASHLSHSELRPKRIASPVVRFNDTTLNNSYGTLGMEKERNPLNHSEQRIDLNEQNKRLKEELLQKEEIIVEIKADADALKKVLNDLQEKVNEAKRHSDNMSEQENVAGEYKIQIERNLETIERYENEIKKLEQELEVLMKQYKVSNKEKTDYKHEIDRLTEKINEIQTQCSEYDAKNTQLKAQIESCERDFSDFIREFAISDKNKLGGEDVSIGDLVETLRKELKSYVENNELSKRVTDELDERVQSYQQEITNLKLKESTLKKRNQAVEEKLEKCEHEIENLKQNELLLKNQLDRVNLSCEVFKAKASELNEKEELIDKLKKNIELSEQNYVEMEKEMNEIREKEKQMFDEIQDKEKHVKILKENINALQDEINKQECEQCKEYSMRDQTRLNEQLAMNFPADQSATTSFDIKSLKDEMFSELAEKLRKELQLSAKLDEKLLSKQKDFAYEQQDHIIQTLNEDKRKLKELLLTERARFESEQLQDADLLEKLRNKLETNKESYKKTVQRLETEMKDIMADKVELLAKVSQLEKSLESYRSSLDQMSRKSQELEIAFNEQKSLREETKIKLKLESANLKSAKEKIIVLENELAKSKDKLDSNDVMTKSDVENVVKEQIALTTQAMKISELEKLLSEQKSQQDEETNRKQLEERIKSLTETRVQLEETVQTLTGKRTQLEERIKSLTETLMNETRKVLRLEAELEVRKTEISEHSERTKEFQEKLREKETNLEIEKERVTTLREKLLEKSKTLAEELEKNKSLEEKVRGLHREVDVMFSQKHNEVEHSKQMRQILVRLMRAESCNKSLVFQKRYLKNMINSYVRSECKTVQMLEGRPHEPVKPKRTFRCVVFTIISISRMKYLRRKRSTTMLRTLR